jgi:uncharacterized protein
VSVAFTLSSLEYSVRRFWPLFLTACLVWGCDDQENSVDGVDGSSDTSIINVNDASVGLDGYVDAGPDALVEPDAEPLPGPRAEFQVRPGVETVTVFNAQPSAHLTLIDPDGTARVTMIADALGQAHFAYLPESHDVLESTGTSGLSLANAYILEPGDGYHIRNDSDDPPSWTPRFRVLAVDDIPDAALYEEQVLGGIHVSPITGPDGDPEVGYQYITARDGVKLGTMVRLPEPILYGDGPYPTVIEYSGYSPSRPDRMSPGALIANAFGYATVSVNMRGTGCSGGVFDFFNRAQHADGYDIIETVARQPWVLNNQVGMVGLSYPGISQLYAASTNPPSLAAIVPLSTIADAWEMQWPGGIYNAGFTRQWVDARESDAAAGGASWVVGRIEEGDSVCEENLSLSVHSLDFETILRQMEMRPPRADDRDLNRLVTQIETAVFYGGSFQDEQTGAQFGAMLDRFDAARALKVVLTNGRHPDGYAPHTVFRWFEFLEFYVAERIPVLNTVIRSAGAQEFGDLFGMENTRFEDDRFTMYETYAEALAAYEAEPAVRVLFESGAGDEQSGIPIPNFEATYDRWPTATAQPIEWRLGPEGRLLEEESEATGADLWRFDPDAGAETFFGPRGYQLLVPLWDIDWSRFMPGHIAAYETAPFTEAQVIAGPGIAELWIKSPVDDVTVQVTLTEVRPDDTEYLIQTGWLRLGHRAAELGDDLRLIRSYGQGDFEAVPVNTWVSAQVAIPSVAHPIRVGSRLRMLVSTPGRDHGTWEFEAPPYEDVPSFALGHGGMKPSRLTMTTLPGIEIPADYPPCPSLRGQPCRTYEALENVTVP